MESVVDKMEVLVRKRDLGRGIFVDEDLGREGREIQETEVDG